MTVTDLPRLAEDTSTPQSQNLAKLREMLNDPMYRPFRDEIERSIVELRAKSALGA